MRGARCARARSDFSPSAARPEALIDAVTAVAAGQRYIDTSLAQKLALDEIDGAGKSVIERLSEREFEVFIRLARGASVQRIAEDLEALPFNRRHSSLQHQTKTARHQSIRAHADCDPRGAH
jgi:DNA-binding NarL/FixJ family response regulator